MIVAHESSSLRFVLLPAGPRWLRRGAAARLPLALGALAGLWLAGCTSESSSAPPKTVQHRPLGGIRGVESASPPPPPPIDAAAVRTADDIVAIHNFWQPMPWINSPLNDRIGGLRVPAYFVSGATGEGAFVSGTILVRLYLIEPPRRGEQVRRLVHTWKFDEPAAMDFRVRKKAAGGYFYGFILLWPESLRLDGREVEVQFGYEGLDGRVVNGATRRMRVAPAGPEPRIVTEASSQPTPRARPR